MCAPINHKTWATPFNQSYLPLIHLCPLLLPPYTLYIPLSVFCCLLLTLPLTASSFHFFSSHPACLFLSLPALFIYVPLSNNILHFYFSSLCPTYPFLFHIPFFSSSSVQLPKCRGWERMASYLKLGPPKICLTAACASAISPRAMGASTSV